MRQLAFGGRLREVPGKQKPTKESLKKGFCLPSMHEHGDGKGRLTATLLLAPFPQMLAGAIAGKNEHLSSSFKLVHNG